MYLISELTSSSAGPPLLDELRDSDEAITLSFILNRIYGFIETAKESESESRGNKCEDMFDRRITMFQAALKASPGSARKVYK